MPIFTVFQDPPTPPPAARKKQIKEKREQREQRAWDDIYVLNKLTNRLIRLHGPTYKSVNAKNLGTEMFYIPKKGTNYRSMQKRIEILKKCGQDCFLGKYPKYPVCSDDCRFNCKNLKDALQRAQLQKNKIVSAEALAMLKKFCQVKKSKVLQMR